MRLELKHVSKSFNDQLVLDDLSLVIKDFHVIAILGPSGSGKSTLLKLIAGIESLDFGTILFNGHEMRESMGYVFQTNNLFPHLTVIENITIVLEKVHRFSKQKALEQTLKLLDQFDLIQLKNKYPKQLSGGEAQRVAIVRSLAIDASLILLDEPTSALDPLLTNEVLQAILQLKKQNKRFIIVTHEVAFAKQIADYVIYIENHKIIEHGNNILNEPKTHQLKRYLGKVLHLELKSYSK